MLSQFYLKLTLRRFRSRGKYVKYKCGAVDHPHVQSVFQVAYLGRGQFIVEYHQIRPVRAHAAFDVVNGAASQIIFHVRPVAALCHTVNFHRPGGPGQLRELVQNSIIAAYNIGLFRNRSRQHGPLSAACLHFRIIVPHPERGIDLPDHCPHTVEPVQLLSSVRTCPERLIRVLRIDHVCAGAGQRTVFRHAQHDHGVESASREGLQILLRGGHRAVWMGVKEPGPGQSPIFSAGQRGVHVYLISYAYLPHVITAVKHERDLPARLRRKRCLRVNDLLRHELTRAEAVINILFRRP